MNAKQKSAKKTKQNFIHVICHLELLRTFLVGEILQYHPTQPRTSVSFIYS